MEYVIHLISIICIYIPLALGLNLVFGLGKLLNFSHIALYAVGAYTTALLSVDYNTAWYYCIPAPVILSCMLASLIGFITKNLKEDYFIIGTVALASVIQSLIINWKDLTRGVLGIPGIPRPEIVNFNLVEGKQFMVFLLCVAAASILFSYFIFRSPISRALLATGEFQEGARSVGVPSGQIRLLSFIFSAGLAGLSGPLYAYFMTYIDPSSFSLAEMTFVVTVVVVGRPGSLWGCIGATIFLVLLPEPLRFVKIPSWILGPMRQLLYAAILFIIVYLGRKKIFPVLREV